MSSVSCLRCFQNLSEIISGWLALEEERFWARPTSTKVGTELKLKWPGHLLPETPAIAVIRWSKPKISILLISAKYPYW